MKLSKYIKEIQLNPEEIMLYNTLSREYSVFSSEEIEKIRTLIENLSKSSFSEKEATLVKTLFEKGLVVGDDIDEYKKLEYLENKYYYQSEKFFLTIYTTNACNFRCTYCTQAHVVKELEDDVQKKIVEIIEGLSKKKKQLHITWFGGEPILQYKKIYELMEVADGICEKNGCKLSSNIVTNGYLLTDEMLDHFSKLHIESMQITVDGGPEIHDKRRVLAGGKGTYEQVVTNVNKALSYGIKVVLRINVDEETFQYPIKVLEDIREEYRGLATVCISNLFQDMGKNSTYSLYKRAIELGYLYGGRKNDYLGCTTCGNNSLVIDTNGDVRFCTTTDECECVVGKIEENGRIHYNNIEKHRQDLMLSSRENEACRECIELPLCIGRCRKARVENNSICMGRQNDGLLLEERARLDYFYDQKRGVDV